MEFTVGNIIVIGVGIFNFVIMIMIKLNDLRHVENNMKILITKVGELSERLSRMEGICSTCSRKMDIRRRRK